MCRVFLYAYEQTFELILCNMQYWQNDMMSYHFVVHQIKTFLTNCYSKSTRISNLNRMHASSYLFVGWVPSLNCSISFFFGHDGIFQICKCGHGVQGSRKKCTQSKTCFTTSTHEFKGFSEEVPYRVSRPLCSIRFNCTYVNICEEDEGKSRLCYPDSPWNSMTVLDRLQSLCISMIRFHTKYPQLCTQIFMRIHKKDTNCAF